MEYVQRSNQDISNWDTGSMRGLCFKIHHHSINQSEVGIGTFQMLLQ